MGTVLTMPRPGAAVVVEAPPDDGEAALVERARGGDIDAWARLYREHFERVLKHVVYLTGDVSAAEDLVQETFARAYVGLPRFAARASFVAWLRGITINVVRKQWRSRYRGDHALAQLEALGRGAPGGAATDPEGVHLRQRRAEVLLAVLAVLPESLREAFVLCDMQEMTTEEAAAALGVSPGNLRVRATRARARIRGELVRLGWLTDDGEDRREGPA